MIDYMVSLMFHHFTIHITLQYTDGTMKTHHYTWIFHILTPSSFLSIMSNSLGRPEPRRMLNMADVPANVWPKKMY